MFRLRSTWHLLVLISSVLGGAAAAAADTAPDPLQSIPLPGGYQILEPLGLTSEVPRAQILPTLIRLLYPGSDGSSRPADARREELLAALAALQRVRHVSDARPDGISLDDATEQRQRGMLRDALEAVGLELTEQRSIYLVRNGDGDRERTRALLKRGGIDVADVLNRLNNHERVKLEVPSVTVPLPLKTETWATLLDRRSLDARDLVQLVLDTHESSWLSYGLLSMDNESRGWVAGTPDVLRAAWNNPAVFVTVARSLVVRNGVLLLPGGSGATRAWERLAGAKLTKPAQFVGQILSRDDGRLAFFFDMVAQLDPAHLAFVLATSKQRKEPLRDLYAVVAAADATWTLRERPFARDLVDTPRVLRATIVNDGGVVRGPVWRALWNAVWLGSAVSTKTATPKWLEARGVLDAVTIAQHVANAKLNDRDDELLRLLFAQRVFAAAAEADAASLNFVLLHFATYRTMLMALERIGITSPATYAAGVRAAIAIGAVDRDQRLLGLTQLQGSLALLVRLQSAAAIETAKADAAARALFALDFDGDRGYEGRVAAWIANDLASLWQRDDVVAPLTTERVIAVLAGERRRYGATFNWESERYTTNTTSYEADRLRTGLKSSRFSSLAGVVSVLGQFDRVSQSTDVDALAQALSDVRSTVEQVRIAPVDLAEDEAKSVVDEGLNAIRNLASIRKAGDLDKVRNRMRPLYRLLDRMTADALRTTAYLLASGNEDLSNLPDLALRHDFGLGQPGETEERERAAPWMVPAVDSTRGGSRIRGSLLALDVAFARTGLRRQNSNAPPRPSSVLDMTANVLGHTLLLADASRLKDTDRDRIAAGIKRGEARLASGDVTATAMTTLSGMSRWRAAAIEWVLANAPAELSAQFTLQEIFLLGAPDALDDLPAWGPSQQLNTGCPCLQLLSLTAEETRAGRPSTPELGAYFADLPLRLAQELARHRLPAALLPRLLAFATEDVLSEARCVDDDDVMALSRAARALTGARVTDYVAAVVGSGLVPAIGDAKGTTP